MDCYDKAIECLDENGEQRVLQGKKETSVRMVTSMPAKRSCREGVRYSQCIFPVMKVRKIRIWMS